MRTFCLIRLQRGGLLAQHDVDHGVDVAHINRAFACHISDIHCCCLAQHDVDDGVDVGHIDRAIAIDISGHTGSKGRELVERGQRTPGLVVPQAGIVPVIGHALGVPVQAIFVGLGPPPEQPGDTRIVEQLLNHCCSEGTLALVGDGVGGRVVVVDVVGLPLVVVSCLDYHDVLAVAAGVVHDVGDGAGQLVEAIVVVGIVAQSHDVVVDRGYGLVVAVEQRDVAHELGVDDNLGLGTHLTAGLAGMVQQVDKAGDAGGIAHVQFLQLATGRAHRAPQHAVRNLVARLDVVGRGTGGNHGLEALTGVLIQLVGQLFLAQTLPRVGRVLLDRVGPAVAVVEVEHQLEACGLDAGTQCHHIVQVLAHALALVVGRGF